MRSFLSRVVSVFKWYFLLVGILCTLSLIWFLGTLNKISNSLTSDNSEIYAVDDSYSVISISLDGIIYDEDNSTKNLMRESLYGNSTVSLLSDIKGAIAQATKDKNVQGIVLNIGDISGVSSIVIERIQKELTKFREAGKFVFANLRSMDAKTLLLTSLADKRIINPTGEVMLVGYNFDMMYLGSFMKKIGVDINVIRMGEYKNAFEFLVSDEPSSQTVEEYTALGSEVEKYYIDTISENMKQDPKRVAYWFRQGMFSVREAELEGMVSVGYISDYLTEAIKDFDPSKGVLSYLKYIGKDGKIGFSSLFQRSDSGVYEDSIGVIRLEGEISMGTSGITTESFDSMYRWAMNPKIKGVVVKINSPGGELISSDLIWHKLKLLADTKPVVVLMEQMAASGGYYIATAAKYIYAHPTTITGSIGVIGMIPKLESFKQKYGISFSSITSSDRKSLLTKGGSISSEDRRMVQESIKGHYNTFLERVVAGRGKDINYWDRFAKGRVYLGTQAKEYSLIDEFGDESDAVTKACQLAGVEELPVVRYQESQDVMGLLKNAIPVLGMSFGIEGLLGVEDRYQSYTKGVIQTLRKHSVFAISSFVLE